MHSGMEGFYDDFKASAPKDEEALFSNEDFQRLRSLFLEKELSLEDLHSQYKALLQEIFGAKGRTVEWAQEHHGSYPWVMAYSSLGELETVRAEAVAAAEECVNISGTKEEWVPPPPDEEPETAADYE